LIAGIQWWRFSPTFGTGAEVTLPEHYGGILPDFVEGGSARKTYFNRAAGTAMLTEETRWQCGGVIRYYHIAWTQQVR
jgi:hypothetical protein